jgi:hypothetical protein
MSAPEQKKVAVTGGAKAILASGWFSKLVKYTCEKRAYVSVIFCNKSLISMVFIH